jgi:tetratricopeptide (TPR) repeat protein
LEARDSLRRQVQQNEKGVAEFSSHAEGIIICSTCGFQNPAGTKSCESCGAFLKGVEKGQGNPQSLTEKIKTASVESPEVEPKRIRPKEVPAKKEKREEAGTQGLQNASRKRFRPSTIQVATVVAALLLGSIFVYGIMSTKSVAPQADNTSGPGAQQQSATNQPNADVLNEIDRLRQVVDKNPSDLVSTLRLSNMLQDNGMYDQAAIYYKRYLDKIPDNIDARVDYGVTLYESGQIQDAINQLNQAVKMNPRHQKAYLNLGIICLNAGEIDESNDALRKCIQIDPQSDVGKQAQQILQQHANIKN